MKGLIVSLVLALVLLGSMPTAEWQALSEEGQMKFVFILGIVYLSENSDCSTIGIDTIDNNDGRTYFSAECIEKTKEGGEDGRASSEI